MQNSFDSSSSSDDYEHAAGMNLNPRERCSSEYIKAGEKNPPIIVENISPQTSRLDGFSEAGESGHLPSQFMSSAEAANQALSQITKNSF